MIFDQLRKSAGGTRILSSADLAAYLSAGADSVSGKRVSPDTAKRFAYVFMCVRVLAEGVGQLPLHLMRQVGRAREKALDHPLFPLLHVSPNAFQTAQEFLETYVVHLALRGNFYAWQNWVEGAGGRMKLAELLPLHPDIVTPRLADDGGSVVYDVQFKSGKETLPSAEVFHVKLLSEDGVKGMSPIAHARDNLGLAMALEENAGRFFANGARPGGILSTEQVLGKEGREDVLESWNKQHQGNAKAHRIAVLEHGLKYQQIGLSAEDAEMLASRKLSKRDIAALFRVPISMIQDFEQGASYSSVELQGQSFVDFSLMPYLTRFEGRGRMQLLDDRDRATHFLKFNVGGLARGDMKARAEFYTRQIQNGAMSPNEIRELEDMNPREGGDIYLTPANMLIDGKPPPDPAAA